MTSPDPKSPQSDSEGGGMLPALLAGAGILAVAGLFIFGGDDDAKGVENKDGKTVNSASASRSGDPKGGVASRQSDGANKSARPKPKLNPRIADAVVTEGMAPTPTKDPVPESFPSKEAEIEYWETQLDRANNLLESRQRSQDHVPNAEQRVRETGTEQEVADFARRKAIVADNLSRAKEKVEDIEAKLVALRG